jgi:hypothetical protein
MVNLVTVTSTAISPKTIRTLGVLRFSIREDLLSSLRPQVTTIVHENAGCPTEHVPHFPVMKEVHVDE